MKRTTTRGAIFFVILIVGVVGYYTYLSNRSREIKQDATMTEVQSTISRNLELDYPATPKEVIKYYNRILKCLYNEECTDAEIEQLAYKARELYDEELLAANELGIYMIRLEQEIADYRETGKSIASTAVAASTTVDFFEEDGFEFARIASGYSITQNGVTTPSMQIFLLRRDENKQWKIYGWKLAENQNENEAAINESVN